MGDFKINEKTVFTQSGSAEPVMGSTITGIPAAGVTGTLPVGVTGGAGIRSILQVKTTQTGVTISNNTTALGTGAFEITDLTTTFQVANTSLVLITGMLHLGHRDAYTGRGYITYNHSGISETVIKNNLNSYGCTLSFNHGSSTTDSIQSPSALNLMFAPATANELTIKLRIMTSNSSYPTTFNRDVDGTTSANQGGNTISSLTFWELGTSISPTVTNVGEIDT